MVIVNLNIRGFGGGTKVGYLKQILAKEGGDMLCLKETKTSLCPIPDVFLCGGIAMFVGCIMRV